MSTLGPCRARIPNRCAGFAIHRHHRKLRRHGDNRPVNLLPVCAHCHHEIHRRPSWAISWGLIVPSWADPEQVHPHEQPDPATAGPYAPRTAE